MQPIAGITDKGLQFASVLVEIFTQFLQGVRLCAVNTGQGQVLPFQQIGQMARQIFRIEQFAGLNRFLLIFV